MEGRRRRKARIMEERIIAMERKKGRETGEVGQEGRKKEEWKTEKGRNQRLKKEGRKGERKTGEERKEENVWQEPPTNVEESSVMEAGLHSNHLK